ncbi:GPP34 family phosphoprotein [Promicromonospora sp. MEB111]|uniref:GOLPH3/VPS74 family protein n=1 Tax=Promicromonospora sp. MEB111 TaxID=3040301 RepID=UPI00254E1C23|nr:GPP34 family phosphoprotein [Promicromonospora sp. MEB111]
MDLSLAEEYLLLALDDTSGRPLLSAQHLQFALAGAAVAELTLRGALDVSDGVDGGQQDRFRVTGRATPSDPLQREILTLLDGRRPKDAIRKIGQGSFARTCQESLQQGLAARGVLREEQVKVLGLFPSTTWKSHDPAPETAVRERVLSALTGTADVDEATAALVSLLHATDLTRRIFPDEDRRALKQRAQEIAGSEWAGAAVKRAIDEVNAVMITVMVAATSAATAGTT